jgi:hypothetical protein
VVDKLLAPVVGAKVCVKGSATHCVLSGPDGAFHLTPGSVASKETRLGFRALGYSLDRSEAGFDLMAPRPGRALLEWRDVKGLRLGPVHARELRVGSNPLAAPDDRPESGIVLLRVLTEGMTLTWKSVWGSSSGPVGSLSEDRPMALSKAAAPVLEATKAGYGARAYPAERETETGVQIMLPAEGEVALFDGRSLDGWKGNMANWTFREGAIRGKGAGGNQLITDGDYSSFRFFARFRNISGRSHLGILFWGKRQFGYQGSDATCVMPHDGGQWDYHTSGGGGVPHQSPPEKARSIVQTEWHYTELLADRNAKTFQMATNGIWMINHKYALSTLHGPIGLQLHDSQVEFEAKDIFVEVDPKQPGKLLTVK